MHSGDSACALPPQSLRDEAVATIATIVERIAEELGVVGLINVQFAVKGDEVYVIEANPRASRTVPFVAKATGVALAKVAVRTMLGHSLALMRDSGLIPATTPRPTYVSAKEAVLPFNRFPSVDTVRGRDALDGRSDGNRGELRHRLREGAARRRHQAAHAGNGVSLPGRSRQGAGTRSRPTVARAGLHSGGHRRHRHLPRITRRGRGHARRQGGSARRRARRGRTHCAGSGSTRDLHPSGRGARADGAHIRGACVVPQVPCLTTVAAGLAAALGMAETKQHGWRVRSLQELHE